ncbi:MAG: rRNA maturation RNase YbeY [Bryobacterales bacterium]|nr:rRNA maturation RNase YbeY [Bryobacterales bacterium]
MSPEGSRVLFPRVALGLDRKRIRAFHRRLCGELAGGSTFTCLLSNDKELRRLNLMFLGHDYPTDVLSFPSGEAANLGDVAISIEQAELQAEEFGHSLEEEISILMLHGVLHLMGMDHEKDRGRMARKETAWRKKLGLPAGLIARARRSQ